MIFVLWIVAAAAACSAGLATMDLISALKPNSPAIQLALARTHLGLSLLVFVCSLGLGGIMKKLDELSVQLSIEASKRAPKT